jgi:multidrug resistance efflux pump
LPVTVDSPLITLLGLARRARQARDPAELGFLAVNDTHALAPYRQAVLWFGSGGVTALSGVVQPEANVPYVQWLERACAALHKQTGGPRAVTAADLPEAEAADWPEWLPAHGLVVPLAGTDGLMLLARDAAWNEQEIVILAEWFDTWRHAWQGLHGKPQTGWKALRARVRNAFASREGRRWWQQPWAKWTAGVIAVLLIPVRLSVLAPGELVPSDPAVIRAPFDGVVAGFLVKPNDTVQAGQPLFSFDDATIASRLEVARQSLATAEAEYRQANQQALGDAKYKAQLVVLAGKIEERRAELAYLQGQLDRSRVLAPRGGIALFDDPAEWVGKPVQTGERILRVAAPDRMEVEAWLTLDDAIPLTPGAPVTLYLNASPFDPVDAKLRYVAHDASARPDGSFAYRVRADLAEKPTHRIGLKGTAKLTGGWVPLGYWMLRRPVAAVRQFLGW